MNLRVTQEVWKEGKMFVAYCPELDVSSCGPSTQKASENLREAIRITVEETIRMGTLDMFLESRGLQRTEGDMYDSGKELVGFSRIEVAA